MNTGPSSDPGTYEIIFGGNGIVVIGEARATSGVGQCIFNIGTEPTNGGDEAAIAWSASSTNAGPATVTVPAGTFQTTRWNWQVTISGDICWPRSITGTSYAVSNASVVRVDGTISGVGSFSYEHQSGPVANSDLKPGAKR